MRRLLAALPIALLALLPVAPGAAAHTELTASDPAEGAQLPAAPAQLTLTFNEPVQMQATTIAVTGPGGVTWQVGTITARDNSLLVPVTPTGTAGQYTIDYRIGSADDHPVTGAIRFTLTAPVTTTTTAPPTTTTTSAPAPTTTTVSAAPAAQQSADDGGIPAWVWIVGVVVLAAIGVAVAVLTGRRRRTSRS